MCVCVWELTDLCWEAESVCSCCSRLSLCSSCSAAWSLSCTHPHTHTRLVNSSRKRYIWEVVWELSYILWAEDNRTSSVPNVFALWERSHLSFQLYNIYVYYGSVHTCSWFFSLSAVRTEISCFSLNTRSSLGGGEHTYVYRREGLIEVFESSPTHSSWLSLRASSNRLRPYLRPDNKMDGIDTEDTDTLVHMPSL